MTRIVVERSRPFDHLRSGQLSPGSLQLAQQPSKLLWQIPQISSGSLTSHTASVRRCMRSSEGVSIFLFVISNAASVYQLTPICDCVPRPDLDLHIDCIGASPLASCSAAVCASDELERAVGSSVLRFVRVASEMACWLLRAKLQTLVGKNKTRPTQVTSQPATACSSLV